MTFVLIITKDRRPLEGVQNAEELATFNKEAFYTLNEDLRVEYMQPNEMCRGYHPDLVIVDCRIEEEFYNEILCPMRDLEDIPVIYKRQPGFL